MLDEVPLVAVKVEEHDHSPVRLLAWSFGEPHAVGLHVAIVVVEISRFKEEEHTTTGLVADVRFLLGRDSAGKQ